MNADPFGPMIDAQERDIEIARRRMLLPVWVLATLFAWLLCYGLFVLASDAINAWIRPFVS